MLASGGGSNLQALLEHQRNRRALQRLSHDLEVARAFNASVLDNAAEGILVVGDDGLEAFFARRDVAEAAYPVVEVRALHVGHRQISVVIVLL